MKIARTMKRFTPFTTAPGIGSKPLTAEQAATFLSAADIEAGQQRGDLKTRGMWQLPVSYTALATAQDFDAPRPHKHKLHIFGPRTLTNVRQSGHELEGRVSVNGVSYRGFTSSCLFDLPDGTLVNVAIIHVCVRKVQALPKLRRAGFRITPSLLNRIWARFSSHAS